MKWKIFRIVNYFQLTSSIVFLLLALATFFRPGNSEGTYWGLLAVSLFFLVFILNSILNLHIMRKFFPDTLLSKKIIRLQNVATFFFSLVIMGLLFVFISTFTDGNPDDFNKNSRVFSIFFILLLVTSVFIWPIQVQLETIIQKNNTRKIKSMISSIGEGES